MPIDYAKTCFVIMPFGKKQVNDKEIDFDAIYKDIFLPAISAVTLPEGGQLIPKRTDSDLYAANIDVEMYGYIEYSRFAFVDITGLNANVFYELGIRHHANLSGTAIFRQADNFVPFDISHIKVLPYEYEPLEHAKASITLITEVLESSLIHNKIDSPIQVALVAHQLLNKQSADEVDNLLLEAKRSMRNNDLAGALNWYKKVIAIQPNGTRFQEYGLILKSMERWADAAHAFETATKLSPQYGEAWRELGIVQNRIYKQSRTAETPSGEDALKMAIQLNPDDFDALASLGGIYKRQGRKEEAIEMYSRSLTVSHGHSYPLLNLIIMQVMDHGVSSITSEQRKYMRRAAMSLKRQIADTPVYNAPWCYFDLSTIYLFENNANAVTVLEEMQVLANDSEYQTHYDTLALLSDRSKDIPMLDEVMSYLKQFVN